MTNSTTTLGFLSFFIFLKNFFFYSVLLDLQFGGSLAIWWLSKYLDSPNNQLADNVRDIIQFFCHTLFISLGISLVHEFFLLAYGTIFYYGLVNTLIGTNLLMFVAVSGAVQLFHKWLTDNLSTSSLGRLVLNWINYYYNIFIASHMYIEQIKTLASHIYQNYLVVYFQVIGTQLAETNAELSKNSKSIMIKNHFDEKYAEMQKQIADKMFDPKMAYSFNSSLGQNPFAEMYQNGSFSDKEIFSSTNINMDFFKNTNLVDDIDDLEDVEFDEIIPEKQEEQKLNAKEENKVKLRKKLADKKNQRGAPRNQPQNPKQAKQELQNMMSMPGMDKMMETMLQGDNLEKIMKSISPDKIGTQMPKMDPEQMKQIMQMMMKNKN